MASNLLILRSSTMLAFLAVRATAGAVIYVDADAPGPELDGQSWCTAFLDLQSALALAQPGDDVRLADGVYTPDQGPGQVPGDRHSVFSLPPGIQLEGGHAGCGAPDPGLRDCISHRTVLSGDLLRDDGPMRIEDFAPCYPSEPPLRPECRQFDIDGNGLLTNNDLRTFATLNNYDDNASQILALTDSSTVNLVSCLTITGANNLYPPHGAEGATHADNTIVEFSRVTFLGNASAGAGSAISAPGSQITLSECSVTGNCGEGGSAAVWTDDSFLEIDRSRFVSNSRGVLVTGMPGAHISRTILRSNSEVAIRSIGSTLTLSHTALIENRLRAIQASAGLISLDHVVIRGHTDRALFVGNVQLSAYDCIFDANTDAWGGGAIYAADSVLDIRRSRFTNNEVPYYGGAVHLDASTARFESTVFYRNSAPNGWGGAIFTGLVWGGLDIVLQGCTLADNYAHHGASVAIDSGDVSATNSIFWAGGFPDFWVHPLYGTATADYCCIQPDPDVSGGNNTSENPQFVGTDNTHSTLNENLRLSENSPCRDMGDPMTTLDDSRWDLDGKGRILCSRTDMGAYEFGKMGDMDCSQAVDLLDYAMWDECVTGPVEGGYGEGCEGLDFDVDGDCDLLDWRRFQIAFGCGADPSDCNLNGTPDSCDIRKGFSGDENGDGIPDECEGSTALFVRERTVFIGHLNEVVISLRNGSDVPLGVLQLLFEIETPEGDLRITNVAVGPGLDATCYDVEALPPNLWVIWGLGCSSLSEIPPHSVLEVAIVETDVSWNLYAGTVSAEMSVGDPSNLLLNDQWQVVELEADSVVMRFQYDDFELR